MGGGGPGETSLRLRSCIPLLVKLLVLALFSPLESTLTVFVMLRDAVAALTEIRYNLTRDKPLSTPVTLPNLQFTSVKLWPPSFVDEHRS